MNFFYSHVIEIDPIITELNKLDLTEEQKIHLAGLIDSTMHHNVLDLILSELTDEDKKLFLEKLHIDPHDKKLMDFLSERTDNIEDKIKQTAEKLKDELYEDLKEAHQRNKK